MSTKVVYTAFFPQGEVLDWTTGIATLEESLIDAAGEFWQYDCPEEYAQYGEEWFGEVGIVTGGFKVYLMVEDEV